MSQFDFQPLDAESDDGTKLVQSLNSWVPAVVSQHAGTTRPAYLKQGSIWVDNSGSPELIAAFGDFYDSLKPEQQQKVREFLNRGSRWGHHDRRG